MRLPYIIPRGKAGAKQPPQELAAFGGMNNTVHPSLLKPNELSVLQNAEFDNGIITKRFGSVREGDYITVKHSEGFTATTKRAGANYGLINATLTTGHWTTTGTASLFTNNTTPDTSTYSDPTAETNQRHVVMTSDKTVVITYRDASAGGIKARKSTDYGATWTNLLGAAGETTIDATGQFWSVWIDGSDDIHIVYAQAGDYNMDIKYRQIPNSTWLVGSEIDISTGTVAGSATGDCSICHDGTNLWISYTYYTEATSLNTIQVRSSTDDGATWSATSTVGHSNSLTTRTALVVNSSQPLLIQSTRQSLDDHLYSFAYNGSSWGSAKTISLQMSDWRYFSCCRRADNDIWVSYPKTGGGLYVSKWNGTSWGSTTYLTSATNDRRAVLCSDGTNVWAVWSKYEAANQYELTFKLYDGTSWSSESTDITADNANNINPSVCYSIGSTNIFPILWSSGTASPYNINCRVVQLSGLIESLAFDSGAGSQTYTAQVTSISYTGGTVSAQYADSATETAGTYTSNISSLSNRYVFFRLTLTTTNLANVPVVSLVEITYGGLLNSGLFSFTTAAGTGYLLAIGSTGIYVRESGTTWLNIKNNLTTNLRTTAAVFDDYLILTNGTDNVMRFSGKIAAGDNGTATCAGTTAVTGTNTSWATANSPYKLAARGRIKFTGDSSWYTISSVTNDTALVLTGNGPSLTGVTYEAYAVPDLEGSPPTGKYVTVWKNHVFITGNSTEKNRLYFSNINVGTTWTTASDFTNVDTDDGQVNTGFVPLRDVLLIFKYDVDGTTKSVHVLTGSTKADFDVRPLTTQYGAISGYAIVPTPNAVYFPDRTGIIETNGITFGKVDYPIEDITKDWNHQYMNKAAGIFYDNKVIFAIPYQDSTINNYELIFDLQTRQWSYNTGRYPSSYAIYTASNTPELYFGSHALTSAIFKWGVTSSDNGQAINWMVESAELNQGSYFMDKVYKELYTFFEPTGYSLYLNGLAQFATITDSADIDIGSSDFSISLWMESSATTGVLPLLGKFNGGVSAGYGMLVDAAAGQMKLYIGNGSAAVDSLFTSTASMCNGSWHHVVFTYDRSGNATCYVDNVSKGTLDISAISASITNTDNLFLGKFTPTAAGSYYSGYIADPRIYGGLLTTSEIAQLYTGINVTNGLIWHLPIIEGKGEYIHDAISINHGILTGCTFSKDIPTNLKRIGTVTASYALNGNRTYTTLAGNPTSNNTQDLFYKWSLNGLTASSIRFKLQNNARDEQVKLVRLGALSQIKSQRRT